MDTTATMNEKRRSFNENDATFNEKDNDIINIEDKT